MRTAVCPSPSRVVVLRIIQVVTRDFFFLNASGLFFQNVSSTQIGSVVRSPLLITGVREAVVSFENVRLSAIFTKANATEHGGRAGSVESENANDRL